MLGNQLWAWAASISGTGAETSGRSESRALSTFVVPPGATVREIGIVRYWTLMLIGLASIALVLWSGMLQKEQQQLQQRYVAQQELIEKSAPTARLNKLLIQSMASAAVRSNDRAIRRMLASHGISIATAADQAAEQGAASGVATPPSPQGAAANLTKEPAKVAAAAAAAASSAASSDEMGTSSLTNNAQPMALPDGSGVVVGVESLDRSPSQYRVQLP